MKKIIIFFCLFSVFSCKKGNNNSIIIEEKNKQAIISKDVKKEISVKITAEYLNNDNIWLFYAENIEETSFTVENSLVKHIKGQEGFQEIYFEFPEDVFPERIKIRFGNNKDQKKIKLEEILISRKENLIKINKENLKSFFNYSKYISTEDGFNISLKVIDEMYDPNIVSSSRLDNELVIL